MVRPPEGDPAPLDGALCADALAQVSTRPFGWYVHVPYCRIRCGYCDFNTYLPSRLGAAGGPAAWEQAVHREIDLARRVLGTPAPTISTVFFGGGTPTMVAPSVLGGILAHLRDAFPVASEAEITTEANPETVGPRELSALRRAGFNRLSLGMQSATEHVLRTLGRAHTPGRVAQVVGWARAEGWDQLSLDLIYGTPGESVEDWARSLDEAVDLAPDHVSAYALTVEPGTAMGRAVASGALPDVDPDVQADRYLQAEQALRAAGHTNYEISNWARSPEAMARHNLIYWRGHNWWGAGPGAHSHIGGVRWWNVKHPARYASLLAEGNSPAQARETLCARDRRVERVLLEIRILDGLDESVLTPSEQSRLPDLAARGLIERRDGRVHLTLPGRLLADAVVRDLLD